MRRLVVRLGLVVAMALLPRIAQAAPILIAGDALGCFGAGCTPTEVAVLSGLIPVVYSSSAPLDFSGVANPDFVVDGVTSTFGTLSVPIAFPPLAISTPFTLLLTFSSPTTSFALFTAEISGTISFLAGGLLVDFDPLSTGVNGTISGLPFFDPATGQSGTLSVFAVGQFIRSGEARPLGGVILTETASVPEPGALALVTMGLAALAGRRRLRHR